MEKKIVAIVGPTAAGKTDLAVRLCRKFNGEIVSVDSRQVYKGMEIGTGKSLKPQMSVPLQQVAGEAINPKCGAPRASERSLRKGRLTSRRPWLSAPAGKVPIHLYDIVYPNEQLNAYDFSLLAKSEIGKILKHGRTPFLAGGTGFYLDVILGRIKLAGVGADKTLRENLGGLSNDELLKRLQVLDPVRAAAVDVHNRHRLIRAVEIEEGRIKNRELRMKDAAPQDFRYLLVGLTAENQYLYKLADERVDRMIKEGLVDEVSTLVEKYGWEAPGLRTLGYREFKPYFEGRCAISESIQRLKYDTHAYIRRQKTYFEKNKEIVWFEITESRFDKKAVIALKSFLGS